MRINYQNIVLRDEVEADIADAIRWNTTETAWGDWDAPWEPIAFPGEETFRREWLAGLARPREGHRWRFAVDTAEGVHIGQVNTYCLDGDFNWQEAAPEDGRRDARLAVGIDIQESAYWSGGWGTRALTAFVRYHLDAGYTNLYTQTWSGNTRMIGLAEKLGFRECRRKAGIRQVRGKTYDGLTFRLDLAAFAAHCRRSVLELHIPGEADMAFVQRMQADPATMAYNAGWDVADPRYHADTGCIDFPETDWAEKAAWWVGHEPERFYALLREPETGAFVGEVNFHTPSSGRGCDMGVVLFAPYRGRGYGAPALELLLRRAFMRNGVQRLCNCFEPDRTTALAIHRAAGFRRVGTTTARRFGREVELVELELDRETFLRERQ